MELSGARLALDEPRSAAIVRLLMPALALGVLVAHLAVAISGAGFTLGFDYLAYDAAARRVLAGEPLYDMSYTEVGPFGLFIYPPPFILLALPFAFLEPAVASWVWMGAMLGAYFLAVRLMPVSSGVRWLIVLLAGISWPFVFGIRLGQVAPLLLLTFVAGWRAIERPDAFGVAAAAGTLIKGQPALLFLWAVAARRWQALLVGLFALGAGAAVSVLLTGLQSWLDFAVILRQVSDGVTQPQNLSAGATAYFLTGSRETGTLVQGLSTVAVLLLVVTAAHRMPGEASFISTVAASQLISPYLWDHYALLLLIPVAWLIQRGHWWAVLVPLSQAYVLVPFVGSAPYLAGFWLMLLAPLVVALGDRRATAAHGSIGVTGRSSLRSRSGPA